MLGFQENVGIEEIYLARVGAAHDLILDTEIKEKCK